MRDKNLHKRLLEISYKNKLHHLGSYFSSLDTMDEIFSEMSDNDIFILSNGHAAVALYVTIEKYHSINAEELLSDLGEHPKRDEQRKIYCSTGSLGMGITVAVGRAISNRKRNVYCMISDGECYEGSVWEALQYAEEAELDNLKIYVNANGYAAYREVNLKNLENKLKAFNSNIQFKKTKVEYFGLSGISAHYDQLTEEQYQQGIDSL
jgi:transketolase